MPTWLPPTFAALVHPAGALQVALVVAFWAAAINAAVRYGRPLMRRKAGR